MIKEQNITSNLFVITLSGNRENNWLVDFLWVLDKYQLCLNDIEQFVAGEICTTTIVAEFSEDKSSLIVKDILLFGHENNVEVDFEVIKAKQTEISQLGFFAELTGVLAAHKVNLDFAERLSESSDPLACYEIVAKLNIHRPIFTNETNEADSVDSLSSIRSQILALGKKYSVDTAIQRSDLLHRTKRLVAFDLSWTLISNDALNIVIEAAAALSEPSVAKSLHTRLLELQRLHQDGTLVGDEYYLERAQLLRGFSVSNIMQKIDGLLSFTEGSVSLCRTLTKLGYKTAILSSGPHFLVEHVKRYLGMDFAYGNIFETDAMGYLTGEISHPIINANRKADLLQMLTMQERIGLEQVIAVGDGPVSLEMLSLAGMAISVDQPDATDLEVGAHLCGKSLMTVLYLLGIRGRDALEMSRESFV
ncbi:Phosphoserine phosphatase [Galdieria sulphuraria]|nr:Phosphoserine phosphatase [Galdieria sulphuraria]